MGEWEVYKIMKNGGKDEFSVELASKRISCGCRHFRRIEFKEGQPVSGIEFSGGCPYHESSEKSLDDSEVRKMGRLILEYLKGKRTRTLNPANIRVIGFYIHYWGDQNKEAVKLIVNVETGEVIGKGGTWDVCDKTVWCGHCIEDDDTCDFRETLKGVPRCLPELIDEEVVQ